MRIGIETIYEHTDKLGDTLRVEKIKNVEGLIVSVHAKGEEKGISVHMSTEEATALTRVVRKWANTTARDFIRSQLHD